MHTTPQYTASNLPLKSHLPLFTSITSSSTSVSRPLFMLFPLLELLFSPSVHMKTRPLLQDHPQASTKIPHLVICLNLYVAQLPFKPHTDFSLFFSNGIYLSIYGFPLYNKIRSSGPMFLSLYLHTDLPRDA